MLSNEVLDAAIQEFGRAWCEASNTTHTPPGEGIRRRAGLLAVLAMPDVQREIVRDWRDDQEAAQSEMLAQAIHDGRVDDDRTPWPDEEEDLPF